MTSTESTPTARRQRGRRRDPDYDQAILRATVELLGEHEYRSLTVDAIADRAGVAKTTLYRRWPRKADLVLDAVEDHLGPREVEETGDALEDLRRLLGVLYRELADSSAGRSWPLIAARLLAEQETAQQYRARLIEPRREQAARLLRQAVDDDQIPAGLDLELVAIAVAAPATFVPLAYGHMAPTTMGRELLDLLVTRHEGIQ